MKKPNHIRVAVAALLAAVALSSPDVAQAQKLRSTSAPPVQADPVPGQGGNFTPAMATATTAYVGLPRLEHDTSCTEYNPCALPSSAPRTSGPLVAQEDALPGHAGARAPAPSRPAALR
ncbi:MAG TPA: hypothetical protein VN718_00165 [Rhizomicrobium sp.]|nr:hypothetical protein [Rhizomicrobium sp.]